MKKYALTSLLLLAAIAGCKKSNDHTANKQFTYSGSSDALSEGRYNMQVLKTGDYTCFAGGDVFTLVPFGTTPSSNIDVYHEPSASWSRVALSFNRTAYATAALNNKLLVGGGISNRLLLYDIKSNSFDSSSHNINEKKFEPAAATVGSKVLIAGGVFDGKNANNVREIINYKQVRVYEMR